MRSQISSFDLTRARLARALPGGLHSSHAVLHPSPDGPLDEIRECATAGRIVFIPRARERMQGVRPRDVRHALGTAEACHRQDHGRWRVEGTGLSGEKLSVVVVIDEGDLVVTAS